VSVCMIFPEPFRACAGEGRCCIRLGEEFGAGLRIDAYVNARAHTKGLNERQDCGIDPIVTGIALVSHLWME
jgi:hypothetical protein